MITFKSGRTEFAHEAIYKGGVRRKRILLTYRFGNALDFYEAHAAVARNGKPLVITETGDLDTSGLARLVDSVSSVDLQSKTQRKGRHSKDGAVTYEDGLSIDVNIELVVQSLRGAEVW